MTPARLLPRENFRRRRMKKGNQLRQGSGNLVLQRHLADPRGRPIRKRRIRLPENMESDILVGGVGGVCVGAPIGGVAMQLHIPHESPAIGRGKRGAQEVRPRPMIPDAGVVQPDGLPGQGQQRVLHQLLKPDPLQDGLRQNRPRLLPEKICPNPAPIPQAHKDKTTKNEKGCGLFGAYRKR